MPTKARAGRTRQVYKFIESHRSEYSVQAMCAVLDVAPSGYYAWLKQPMSDRAIEDARLLRLKQNTSSPSTIGLGGTVT